VITPKAKNWWEGKRNFGLYAGIGLLVLVVVIIVWTKL
jgi:hypothetical protein